MSRKTKFAMIQSGYTVKAVKFENEAGAINFANFESLDRAHRL